MVTTKDIVEETVEDLYTAGAMDDEEYQEAVEMINNDHMMGQVEKYMTDDIKKRWLDVMDDYRNDKIAEAEYTELLEQLMDEFDDHRTQQQKDDFDRAMQGV